MTITPGAGAESPAGAVGRAEEGQGETPKANTHKRGEEGEGALYAREESYTPTRDTRRGQTGRGRGVQGALRLLFSFLFSFLRV